jgi:molecular chaperone DnaK
MSRVIGIDLGTTNSCVAAVVDGAPVVLANRGGYTTTPSIIAVAASGRRLVGHIAKRQAITNAEFTVFSAKRLIGRKWNHPIIEKVSEELPFSIIEGDEGDVRIQLRDIVFSVPEISAMILSEMKRVAEEHFGEPVEKAVVTIPAYFQDGQRQATMDAGRIAGLDVIRIINEPTAAALAFGFKKESENKRIAVFDLGGGTFDISVLDIGDSVYEVLATGGDTYLGGEDIDWMLVQWLDQKFQEEHAVSLTKDPMARQRLRDAAEKAKIALSSTMTADVHLPFITSKGMNESLHLQETVTREQLEDIARELVEKTKKICDRTLKSAGIDKEEIQDVILVGGQTRMPLVQNTVREYFGVEPSKNVHPDEVVALGAALQVYSLTHDDADDMKLLLLDVTPHNLGIMIAGGKFQTLIPANTTVPTSVSHTYTTSRDDQTAVKIVVLQGDSEMAIENELLGEFILTGLRKAVKGGVEIEVMFEISSDGIVSVSARDLETGTEQSIQVTSSNRLSADELERIIEENEKYAIRERVFEEFGALRDETEKYLRDIEELRDKVAHVFATSGLEGSALEKTDKLVQEVKEAIKIQDAVILQDSLEPLARAVLMFKGVSAKLGQ